MASMDESYFRTTPSIRASVARSRADTSSLAENEVVFVQRTGPRILKTPSKNPTPLDGGTLRDLGKGKLSQKLAGGRRIAGSRMMACPDIEVEKNGSYTLKKTGAAYKDMDPITVNTLDVWTGEVGKLREDIDISNLTFYSVKESLLPSYHSWKDHDAANEVKEVIKPNLDLNLFSGIGGTGRYIDLVDKERGAAAAEKIANDPEEKLRIKPSIRPSDEAWEEIEAFFRWILEDEMKKEHPQILKLIKKEFNEAQWLLLTPTSTTSSRSQIQVENAESYQEALKTTFATQMDNLVTKLAMLCFGLPIAPITLTNIKYAGGRNDVPGKEPSDTLPQQTQNFQTILWSEKPLEFLDVYHSRGYGYPIIRSKQKPYNAIDTKSADDPKLTEMPKRQTKFPRKSKRFGCGQTFQKRERAHNLHLRGGGGDPVMRHKNPPTHAKLKINVYTEMGRFEIVSYEELRRLIARLFRTSVSKFNFDIDILQDAPPGLKDFTEVVQSFGWSSTTPEAFDQNQFENYTGKKEVHGKYKLRVRQGGNIREPYEPNASESDLVEICLKDVGVAYWHLPENWGEAVGTNQYQDTFRNAIECLLPDHWQHVVQWEVESKTTVKKQGQLTLAAEAPSKDLWETILVLVKASKSRVRINIKVISKKELASATETRSKRDGNGNEGELMIVVPGSAKIAISPLFGGDNHEEFLEKIRTAVHARTSPQNPAIRLWSGPENYSSEEQGSRFVIFPPKRDKEDRGLLMGASIIFTADAVVVRPEFNNFRVIDVQNKDHSASWNPQKVKQVHLSTTPYYQVDYYSLDSFQKALARLWPGYTTKEHVGIIQSQSNDMFVIGPEMTDQQWRLQVFDWLDDENVTVQRNVGRPLIYKKPHLKGPLGVTYSSGVMPTVAERRVQIPKSLPASTSGTLIPDVMTPREEASRATWNAWVKKQDEAFNERVAAFTADPSIFRRAKTSAPDISIFGQPFEYGISVGSQFPTIFTQMKTPAQVNELQRENRKLENIVLDRIQSCQMCSMTFPFGPTGDEFKRVHLQDHITKLNGVEEDRIAQFGQGLGNELPNITAFDGVKKSVKLQLGQGSNVYCAVCGLTDDEFRKKNTSGTHNQTCFETMMSKGMDRPEYCVYCGLHLQSNGLLGKNAKYHITECSSRSHGSAATHAHVAMFEKLFKRLTGQSTLPPGYFKCHFQNCDEIFTPATDDSTRVNHFARHLNIEDAKERMICPHPTCAMDIGGFGILDLSKHLQSHPSDPRESVIICNIGGKNKIPSAGGVDPNEDQKNIPERLKKANPGKNFYCPVCFKLLGKQLSPCNLHRKKCEVFGHERWLILTAEEMKETKAITEKPVAPKRPAPQDGGEGDGEPSAKKPKRPERVEPAKKPAKKPAEKSAEKPTKKPAKKPARGKAATLASPEKAG